MAIRRIGAIVLDGIQLPHDRTVHTVVVREHRRPGLKAAERAPEPPAETAEQ